MQPLKIAYLAQGRLYTKQGALAAQKIESEFAQDFVNRATYRYQQNEWKTQNADSSFNQWFGTDKPDPRNMQINITGITNGTDAGLMMYSLQTADIGGLFLYDGAEKVERRLVHKKEFRLRDLDRNLLNDRVACAHYLPSGVANIGILRGHNVAHVTEGDSIDEAPTWVPGHEDELVFQSAGLARNSQGAPISLGPFAVQKLDVEKGTLETLLENPNFDYLQPHMSATGDLYVIKRPYEPNGRRAANIGTILSDIFLFPFRVLRAIFHYLNFISMAYSRQPLTRAGGPPSEGEDRKTLFLRGRRIDAEKALRQNKQKKNELPALVPASWQLLKISASGEESELAKHVVAFDMDENGRLIYTNGMAIYKLDGSTRTEIARDKLIEHVCILRQE